MIKRNVLRRLAILEEEMRPIASEPFILNVAFIDPATKQESGKGFQIVIPVGVPRRASASRRFRNRGLE